MYCRAFRCWGEIVSRTSGFVKLWYWCNRFCRSHKSCQETRTYSFLCFAEKTQSFLGLRTRTLGMEERFTDTQFYRNGFFAQLGIARGNLLFCAKNLPKVFQGQEKPWEFFHWANHDLIHEWFLRCKLKCWWQCSLYRKIQIHENWNTTRIPTSDTFFSLIPTGDFETKLLAIHGIHHIHHFFSMEV